MLKAIFQSISEARPRLMRHEAIGVARERLSAEEASVVAASTAVRRHAERCLRAGVYLITEKEKLAPSGDARDFFSIGTYWWPNPDTEDGLPYVRRDGEINPESMESDTGKVRRLCRDVRALTLAWQLFGDDRYAVHCAELLRAWFVDPERAMNPHLKYAQCVPGVSDGRSWGIIDTRGFRYLVDAALLIGDYECWSSSDLSTMQSWMSTFLGWLLNSPAGRREGKANNNHGTWYSAQTLALALFTGQQALAEKLARVACQRIDKQIDRTGVQPEEYKRTRPLTYCTMNLWAFSEVATLCEATGVDLWRYRSRAGGSLEAAARWLLPYVQRKTDWPEREIVQYRPENYLSLFRCAAIQYGREFEPQSLPLDQTVVCKDLIHILNPA